MHWAMVMTWGCIVSSASAASFDCAKATTAVERTICSDHELSSLDDHLAQAFESHPRQDALKPSQRAWLTRRNACRDGACIRRLYEQRLTELICEGDLVGSAIGSRQCSAFELSLLERELEAIEERYVRRVTEEGTNPEYTKRAFDSEKKAWRTYRAVSCESHGAREGGSDGWKLAFAAMCEVDETKRRITRLKGELGSP